VTPPPCLLWPLLPVPIRLKASRMH